VLIRVVGTVQLSDPKRFRSLLLVEVEQVLMRVVGTAQPGNSKLLLTDLDVE
jgi:hypothetical protein